MKESLNMKNGGVSVTRQIKQAKAWQRRRSMDATYNISTAVTANRRRDMGEELRRSYNKRYLKISRRRVERQAALTRLLARSSSVPSLCAAPHLCLNNIAVAT